MEVAYAKSLHSVVCAASILGEKLLNAVQTENTLEQWDFISEGETGVREVKKPTL